jgi:hypothetical protein
MAGSKSNLDNTPAGERLFEYWAHGKGAAKWIKSAHPYTTLVNLLIKAGVPARSVHGLAANIFKAATGHYPGQREKGERL